MQNSTPPDSAAPDPAPSDAFDPHLHEPSDCVRFQVSHAGSLVNASINRQALMHSFSPVNAQQDLLSIYAAHSQVIHAAVLHRLTQGARAPVMLREPHFAAPG